MRTGGNSALRPRLNPLVGLRRTRLYLLPRRKVIRDNWGGLRSLPDLKHDYSDNNCYGQKDRQVCEYSLHMPPPQDVM
jgi:hypothetical protein